QVLDVCFLDDQRRHQAQHVRVGGGAEDEALGQQGVLYGFGREVEAQAEQQAQAADLEQVGQAGQALADQRLQGGGAGGQPLADHGLQGGGGGGADQRPAAEGGAVFLYMHALGDA